MPGNAQKRPEIPRKHLEITRGRPETLRNSQETSRKSQETHRNTPNKQPDQTRKAQSSQHLSSVWNLEWRARSLVFEETCVELQEGV